MRSRWLTPLVGVVCLVSSTSCSAPAKGGLVLAISTDMQTPKDISVISVFVTTDSVVKFDYVARVLPGGTVALPATLALVEPDNPNAQVRIRVIGFQEQNARVLRDVRTTVPHARTSLLRLPLDFLDDGSGKGMLTADLLPGPSGAPEGTSTFDPDMIQSSCDFSQGETSIDGLCASANVDSSSLPDYDPSEVYGAGPLLANGAPSTCFDAAACFAGATAVQVDSRTCSFPLPAGATASSLNVAIVTPDTGECLSAGCFVPLDNDVTHGWIVLGGTVNLLPNLCARLNADASLHVYAATGACPAKTPSDPLCESGAESGDDGGGGASSSGGLGGSSGGGATDSGDVVRDGGGGGG